jgi:hypothetical protein
MRVLRAGLAAAIAAVLAVISAASPAFANGALAIGACGAYGFARGYADPARAEAAALAKCTGQGCKVVASVRRSCMAFAVELSNPCGSYGYATGGALARVQNQALRECHRNGGKDCVIRTFACD